MKQPKKKKKKIKLASYILPDRNAIEVLLFIIVKIQARPSKVGLFLYQFSAIIVRSIVQTAFLFLERYISLYSSSFAIFKKHNNNNPLETIAQSFSRNTTE